MKKKNKTNLRMDLIFKLPHLQIFKLKTVLLLATACCLLPTVSFAATYTVSNTGNGTTFDGVSLRWAITQANANPGSTIIFSVATVNLTALLPSLTANGTTINGGGAPNTNSTGALNGTLAVTINGGTLTSVITISSDNNIIKGLNFIMGAAAGANDVMIDITTGADNNQILGCYIGTTLAGTGSAGADTEYGVRITGGASGATNNQIGDGTAAGRNLISGMKGTATSYGIFITGAAATDNTIKGNIIGLQKDGATYLATTQQYGVRVTSSATSNIIGGDATMGEGNVISGNINRGIWFSASGNSALGNIIGPQANGTSNVTSNTQSIGVYMATASNNTIGNGTAAGRNIISANTSSGVNITSTTSAGNLIKGNYIGLDITGTTFIAGSSQSYGIAFITWNGAGNIIGGTAAGEGNVISGNAFYGIYTNTSTGISVLGNIIGPQKDGTSNVASNPQDYGVYIDGSPGNTIGGSAVGARNIISANTSSGVYITGATGNSVKGNYIGLSSATVAITPSSSQDYGVYLTASTASTTIGGSAAGEANTIAFNTVNGVYLTGAATDFNKISRNPIYSNTGKPINLNYTTGVNNDKWYPTITTANGTTVGGTSAGATDIIEVFKSTNSNCLDANTWIGTTTAVANTWTLTALSLTSADYVLATATDGSNNTSEFSVCLPVVPLPVELLYFNAFAENNSVVRCEWATASERNNDYFAIEHSKDGTAFVQIGTMKGAPGGNSSTQLNYEFYDHDPYTGLSYYRLKQVDYNGQYEYSPIRAVYIGTLEIISIFPNPAGEYIHYSIASETGGAVTVKLYDALGREVLYKEETIEAGITEKKLPTAAISSGSYLLRITTNTQEKTQKQFVVR